MEGLLHVGHFWRGVVPQQRVHGHDDPRSAEATLGAVSLGDPLLKHVWNRHQQQNVTVTEKHSKKERTTTARLLIVVLSALQLFLSSTI